MKRFSWSLTTLFVLGVASAFAQQPGGRGGPDGGHRPPPIIEALDADHDHVISAEEIKNATSSLMTLDKNRDGKLTENEFRGPVGGPGHGGAAGGGPRGGDRRIDSPPGRPHSGGRPEHRREGRRPSGGEPQGRTDKVPDVGSVPPSPERMVDHAMEFDADKDGRLNKDELMKFAAEFEKHHPRPADPRRDGENSDDDRPESRQRPQRPE